MPIIAAAGIAATATIGTSAIGSRAAGNATKAQTKANDQALAYERERQAEAKREKQEAADAYRKSWNEWYRRVGDEGVKRYGVPVGISIPTGASGLEGGLRGVSTPGSGGQTRDEPAPGAAAVPGAAAQAAPMTLGSMMSAPAGPVGQMAAPMGGAAPAAPAPVPAPDGQEQPNPQGTLGALGGWNDWSRYGA